MKRWRNSRVPFRSTPSTAPPTRKRYIPHHLAPQPGPDSVRSKQTERASTRTSSSEVVVGGQGEGRKAGQDVVAVVHRRPADVRAWRPATHLRRHHRPRRHPLGAVRKVPSGIPRQLSSVFLSSRCGLLQSSDPRVAGSASVLICSPRSRIGEAWGSDCGRLVGMRIQFLAAMLGLFGSLLWTGLGVYAWWSVGARFAFVIAGLAGQPMVLLVFSFDGCARLRSGNGQTARSKRWFVCHSTERVADRGRLKFVAHAVAPDMLAYGCKLLLDNDLWSDASICFCEHDLLK